MKRFDLITLFPKMIDGYAGESILGRAQKKRLIKIKAHDLRKFAKGKHDQVDDKPYGGGPGMVMMVEPIDRAVRKVARARGAKRARGARGSKIRVILTSASGKRFTQADAKRLAEYDQVIFICGRYEGVDARVEEAIADESFSIGDYVLTGGELPALAMTDAIARNVKGVLGKEASLDEESHSEEGVLEYPQYTKPEVYPFKEGRKKRELTVPSVLLSGHHKKIKLWREEESKKRSS